MGKQFWRILLGPTMVMTLSVGLAIAQVNLVYNPSLGTLPEAQGFTRYEEPGVPAPVVGGGVLHTFAQTVPAAPQYWHNNSNPLDFSTTPYVLEVVIHVISSNYIPDIGDGTPRLGYYLEIIDAAGRTFNVGIASTGIVIDTGGGNGVPFTPYTTTDAFHTYRLVIENGMGTLFIDGTVFVTTPVGGVANPSLPNRVLFGDASGFGVSEVELRLFRLQVLVITDVTCNGQPVTILGTPSPDILVGTAGPDVIHGLGDNDGMDGRGGDDIICGGAGDDILLGGEGDDLLLGGNGDDTLSGGPGDDTLRGGADNDRVFGGTGDDRLYGDAGDDLLRGEQGSDRLRGGAGDDRLHGGPGIDSCDGQDDVDTDLGGCDIVLNIP